MGNRVWYKNRVYMNEYNMYENGWIKWIVVITLMMGDY
jgi:hypothetical protein